MESSLKRYAPLGVVLGFAGLIAAAVIWLLQRKFDVYVQSGLVVGLLGFALAMLFNPGAVQAWLGGRQARYGSNVMVMTLAFAGIVILVNYLVVKNPGEWKTRWDVSEDQINTLAPETVEAIKQLPAPVKALGFYSPSFNSAQNQARTLLDRYKIEATGKLTYEFHDPIGEPGLAKEYGITRDGTLLLVMGDQREEISFATEEEITGALIRFSHPTKRVVYFLIGHGEHDIGASDEAGMSRVADLLKKQNYDVQPLNLQVTTTVPSDARALVVAGPLVPVTADEVKLIEAYVQSGGSLVALLDPAVQTRAQPGQADPLVDYLKTAWGIGLPQDVIIDLYNSYPRQPLFPLNKGYEASPITNKLQNISTVFPVARSVVVSGTAETFPSIQYTPLVKTDARAWGETDIESISSQAGPVQGEQDSAGPLIIAFAAENSQTKSRLVVFGDSDFASNNAADQGANAQLFVNSLNWAAVEEGLINLTPKIPTTRSLVLTDSLTINLIFLITVVVMPLAVLIWGGVVWFQRRQHA